MNRMWPRLLLAIAYPLLAHWASIDGGGLSAAVALADLMLLILIDALAEWRAWAWGVAAASVAGLIALARTPFAQMALLAPPMLFTGALAWWFGRSLRAPREALITRIVAGLHDCAPAQLAPDLRRYTRRLTAAWAGLLAALTAINGALALIATPDGVLARLGHPPLLAVSHEQWSLFANLLNYGIVGGFFIGEYLLRHRLFPQRPYRNFLDFLRRMAGLGPRFWRELFQ